MAADACKDNKNVHFEYVDRCAMIPPNFSLSSVMRNDWNGRNSTLFGHLLLPQWMTSLKSPGVSQGSLQLVFGSHSSIFVANDNVMFKWGYCRNELVILGWGLFPRKRANKALSRWFMNEICACDAFLRLSSHDWQAVNILAPLWQRMHSAWSIAWGLLAGRVSYLSRSFCYLNMEFQFQL